jgi:hypothetical protein
MVQPEVANLLLSDRLLAEQGLLSRLLVTAPETAAGTRFWRDVPAEADAAIGRYGARLLSILEAPLPLSPGKVNELDPPRLTLTPAARRTWIGFCDYVEENIAPGGSLEPIRGFANKLPEHAARIAAALRLVADISASELPPDCMDAGIYLAQHYGAEALRLFEGAVVRPEIVRAERLLAWLQGREEVLISLPDIYQLGPKSIRDKRTAAETVAVLEDHGWLTRVEGGAVLDGTRRQEVWRIWRRLG